ncbi:hypothetical protein IKT18_01940 [Candidatus Saccharibacteria bacterium]|nr:hypothetical protein [Candidatus Saccharibacteria bacterium]
MTLIYGAPEAMNLELPEVVARTLVSIDKEGIFAFPYLSFKEKSEMLETIQYIP